MLIMVNLFTKLWYNKLLSLRKSNKVSLDIQLISSDLIFLTKNS